jgi:hypothetical protein
MKEELRKAAHSDSICELAIQNGSKPLRLARMRYNHEIKET